MTAEPAEARTISDLPLTFGAIVFDNKQPGSGWACRAGGEPYRIVGPGDCGSGTMWITNLDYNTLREGGLSANAVFRQSGYLRLSWSLVCEEWGIPTDRPDVQARWMADLLCRVATYGRDAFGGSDKELRSYALANDLVRLALPADLPPRNVRPATHGALQEFTRTQIRQPRETIQVPLRFPRLSYARMLLSLPMPAGAWEWRDGFRLPTKRDEQFSFLLNFDRPMIARVRLENVDPRVSDILGFGSGATEMRSGAPRTRGWAASPELLNLVQHADVIVDGAWLAESMMSIPLKWPDSVQARLNSPLAPCAWSAGVFAENLWVSATKPPPQARKVAGNDERVAPARGVWLRSYDRNQCFIAAARLHELGYAVISYSTGVVRVAIQEDEAAQLTRDAFATGLIAPLSLTMREPIQLEREAWGGEGNDPGISEAILVAAGNRDMLWRFDQVNELPPAEAAQALHRMKNGG